MSILIARATPLHRASDKDGGHVRLRYFAAIASPTASPVIIKQFSNASLVACAPKGDLNRIFRARDLGIGSIAPATALTLGQAREIICTDVGGAAAGSELVLLTRAVPRARLSHNVRGVPINGNAASATHATARIGVTATWDASVDASGRIILTGRASSISGGQRATASVNAVSGVVGYVDILFQHSLFRT